MVKETWVIQPGSLPLWVHPAFERDIREIAGCADTIYEYASEHEIHPYADSEIFKDTVKIIHDHGLRIIVSIGTGGRFSAINPSTWHFGHPETWFRLPPDLANTTDHYFRRREVSCVNNPKFLKYTKQYYSDLLDNYDIDGIGFDEPREIPCVCKYCQKRFEELNHRKMSGRGDEENLRFQAESLSEYITMISDMAKQKGVFSASVTYLQPKEAYFHKLLAEIKSIDYFGIDPYWMFNKPVTFVAEMTKEAREICDKNKKLLWVVIQNFHVPSGREAEIYEAGRLAAENGADVLCGFTHWRATQNPELTWDTTHRMLIDFGPKRRSGKR